jgi:hypothetical protein
MWGKQYRTKPEKRKGQLIGITVSITHTGLVSRPCDYPEQRHK